jgi:hypothetical protein
MRFLVPIAALLVAGCATAPQRPTAPAQPPPQQQQARGELIGLTTGELIQRFGQPTLQVREGAGLKLQFRGRCVLDAYLYPPARGQGPERVTHVDTRLPSGADTAQQSCISALQRP